MIIVLLMMQVTGASPTVDVMAALSQHQYPAAVEAASNVIRSQCQEADASMDAYATAGAFPALLAVLPRHRQHAGVQVAACRSLHIIVVRNRHSACTDRVLFLCVLVSMTVSTL